MAAGASSRADKGLSVTLNVLNRSFSPLRTGVPEPDHQAVSAVQTPSALRLSAVKPKITIPSTDQYGPIICRTLMNQNNLPGCPRSRFWDLGKHSISLPRFAQNYPRILHTGYRHKNGKAHGVSRRQSGFRTFTPKSKNLSIFACEAARPNLNGSESIDYADALHGGTALKSQ